MVVLDKIPVFLTLFSYLIFYLQKTKKTLILHNAYAVAYAILCKKIGSTPPFLLFFEI